MSKKTGNFFIILLWFIAILCFFIGFFLNEPGCPSRDIMSTGSKIVFISLFFICLFTWLMGRNSGRKKFTGRACQELPEKSFKVLSQEKIGNIFCLLLETLDDGAGLGDPIYYKILDSQTLDKKHESFEDKLPDRFRATKGTKVVVIEHENLSEEAKIYHVTYLTKL